MDTAFRLERLLGRRLLIVSGKGGVGKTTVSLALGLLAAQRGKKVLVVEVNSEEQVSHLLQRPPIGYHETELVAGLKGLWGINIDPRKCFEEYVLVQIKFRKLYKTIFENRYVRNFIDATPGLADLMCIGKIYDLAADYDLVIVDAPATGHGIALLEISSIVSRAVRVGPLRTQSEKIDLLLHDAAKTQIVLVTLPEEMPVTEAVEMSRSLEGRLQLPLGPVFLNQFHSGSFTGPEKKELRRWSSSKREERSGLKKMTRLILAQTERSKEYEERLHEEVPNRPLVLLPFIFSPQFGLNEIQMMADAIEDRGEE